MLGEKIIKIHIETLQEMLSFEDSDRKVAALREAINVLQKQIPEKTILESWSPALCPSCRGELSELIGDEYYKHYTEKGICKCGQKLKWD